MRGACEAPDLAQNVTPGQAGLASSADFGVLAGIQLYDVVVATVLRLCNVGVLAAVQRHDAEASGDHLAQVPHSAHAWYPDPYGGGGDRAAEQRQPADHVSQRHHDY